MFRDPWFSIIDVTETHGLSLADIVKQEAERASVRIEDVRGPRTSHRLAAVRRAIYRRAKRERPDLTSSQVGNYMRKNSSTIRHAWRQMEAA